MHRPIQGGLRKKRNGIVLPTICGCNNWYQCIWGNFSCDKWYQDHQFWVSVVCFVRQCWDPKCVPFHLKLGVNECHFGFPQFWAVIQLTLSRRILYIRLPDLKKMRIDKVKWITAHNCGKPKYGIHKLLFFWAILYYVNDTLWVRRDLEIISV